MSVGSIPELMAPAGDWDCARAAVENGADAVYFGLQDGFNARARAANFTVAELPELMTFLRTRAVRGYLTLNTLLFADELAAAERIARLAVAAGVDAVLVQDLGLLRLLHRLCPGLPLHASTQMTLSSAECIREVESLGIRRVVLPRELSIDQIATIHRQTGVELEAFVHGALCISYSGQCLASLSMGGRSANRGQCAQPCRLPYEVLVGEDNVDRQDNVDRWGRHSCLPVACKNACPTVTTIETADLRFHLSPRDLAAFDRLPELIAAGASALKIEGRLKSAEYVACATRHYRTALDAVCGAALAACGAAVSAATDAVDLQAGRLHHNLGAADIADLEQTFSRGFCHGWLDGDDHQALISGDSSAHRGTYLGVVKAVLGQRILIDLAVPVRRGDGVVFEGGEQGGRIYEVFQGRRSVADEVPTGLVELAFRYGAIDTGNIRHGQRLWKTDDPQAARRLRKDASDAGRQRRVAVDMTIEASVGGPLRVTAVAATGVRCSLQAPGPLPEAAKHPLTVEMLTEQFGRLGKTPYMLRRVEAKIDGRPMVPLSILGKLRHELVEQLVAASAQPSHRTIATESVLPELRDCRRRLQSPIHRRAEGGTSLSAAKGVADHSKSVLSHHRLTADATSPQDRSKLCYLHVLCRSLEQIDAAQSCAVSSIILDLPDINRYGEAIRLARQGTGPFFGVTTPIGEPASGRKHGPVPVRAAGVEIWLATPRIHKPGETDVFEMLARLRPDGVLVRNLAGLAFFRRRNIPTVADFSLNAANDLSVDWLLSQGVLRVTAAYDLGRERLLKLADAVDPQGLEVVIHRHTPMFHTEYCLYCRTISEGKYHRDCGRPCLRQSLRLRDRLGIEHPVLIDSQCRNTVFHAEPESLAKTMPSLKSHGIRHFRVELLGEQPEQVRQLLEMHRPR